MNMVKTISAILLVLMTIGIVSAYPCIKVISVGSTVQCTVQDGPMRQVSYTAPGFTLVSENRVISSGVTYYTYTFKAVSTGTHTITFTNMNTHQIVYSVTYGVAQP